MFSLIRTRFPTLDDEKEHQHFTFPPLCLTVGTVYLESNASCGVRQTITLPSDPSKLNLLSSVHSIWSQKHLWAALDIFGYDSSDSFCQRTVFFWQDGLTTYRLLRNDYSKFRFHGWCWFSSICLYFSLYSLVKISSGLLFLGLDR